MTSNLHCDDKGFTLVEMLVACSIMIVASAAIAGLLVLNTLTNVKYSSKVDTLNAARAAIERISRDLRMARNVGDIYGGLYEDPLNPGSYIFGGSVEFPSSSNPMYPSNTPSSFDGWPSGWGDSYSLSAQTLIVQIPVFDSNGFPRALPTGWGNPALTCNQDDVDTLVYQVVQDPLSSSNTPTWELQVAGFPGYYYSGDSHIQVSSGLPQTLLKGIVGPVIGNGPASISNPPAVFQYIDANDPSDPVSTPAGTPADLANYTGMLIQFEIQNNGATGINASAGSAQSTQSTQIGIKTEVFARNNTVQGVTATVDDIGQFNGS